MLKQMIKKKKEKKKRKRATRLIKRRSLFRFFPPCFEALSNEGPLNVLINPQKILRNLIRSVLESKHHTSDRELYKYSSCVSPRRCTLCFAVNPLALHQRLRAIWGFNASLKTLAPAYLEFGNTLPAL